MFQNVAVIGPEIITMILLTKYWKIRIIICFQNKCGKCFQYREYFLNLFKYLNKNILNLRQCSSKARCLEGISYVSLNDTSDSLGHPSFESVLNQRFTKYQWEVSVGSALSDETICGQESFPYFLFKSKIQRFGFLFSLRSFNSTYCI